MTRDEAPSAFDYAAFYCEENALRLSRHPSLGVGERFVVVVTNAQRAVPIMHQRAAPKGGPVVWDYHVFALVERHGDNPPVPVIWDLDCTLGMPLDATAWLDQSFPWDVLPPEFEPLFRVVPAEAFRREFSSDREHMKDDNGILRAPAPAWERPGTGPSNLATYLDVEQSSTTAGIELGALLTRQEFSDRLARLSAT